MTTFANDWDWIETVHELRVGLPGEPERLAIGDDPSRAQLWLADEYGDVFGVLESPDGRPVQVALARALDQLYGVEWGTCSVPTIDTSHPRAEFEAMGSRHLALWARHAGKILLFAVVQPDREARARAFIEGASLRR